MISRLGSDRRPERASWRLHQQLARRLDHRVLTGLDRDSIDMREVSPLSGLLSTEARAALLNAAG